MKEINLLPQRGFLFLGIGSMVLGIGLYYFSDGGLLFYLYFIPGLLLAYFYFASSLTLNKTGISQRTFFLQKKHIDWASVKAFWGTNRLSLIIESRNTKIKILNVYKDRKQLLDFIIKHIDKTKASAGLLSEWSQFFMLYQDEEKNE